MDQRTLLITLLGLLLAGATLSGALAELYIGDSVITDNSKAFINTTPAIITGSDYFKIQAYPKTFTGQVCFGAAVNTNYLSLQPPLQLFDETPWNESIFIDGTPAIETHPGNWTDVNLPYETINNPYTGKTKAYVLQVPLTQNILKTARIYVRAPVLTETQTIQDLPGYDGKIDILFWPATYTCTLEGGIAAQQAGHLILQDPEVIPGRSLIFNDTAEWGVYSARWTLMSGDSASYVTTQAKDGAKSLRTVLSTTNGGVKHAMSGAMWTNTTYEAWVYQRNTTGVTDYHSMSIGQFGAGDEVSIGYWNDSIYYKYYEDGGVGGAMTNCPRQPPGSWVLWQIYVNAGNRYYYVNNESCQNVTGDTDPVGTDFFFPQGNSNPSSIYDNIIAYNGLPVPGGYLNYSAASNTVAITAGNLSAPYSDIQDLHINVTYTGNVTINVTAQWTVNGTNVYNESITDVPNGTTIMHNISATYYRVKEDVSVYIDATDGSTTFYQSETRQSYQSAPSINTYTIDPTTVLVSVGTTTFTVNCTATAGFNHLNITVVDPNTDSTTYRMTLSSGNKYTTSYSPSILGTYTITPTCYANDGNTTTSSALTFSSVSSVGSAPAGGGGGSPGASAPETTLANARGFNTAGLIGIINDISIPLPKIAANNTIKAYFGWLFLIDTQNLIIGIRVWPLALLAFFLMSRKTNKRRRRLSNSSLA